MLPIAMENDQCVVAIANPNRTDAMDLISASSSVGPSSLFWLKLTRSSVCSTDCSAVGGSTVRDLVAMSNDEVEELRAAAFG